jgi:leucyl aminopeptidase (aminopeptidase T)
MDVDRLVRCVGRVDWKLTRQFVHHLTELTRHAKKVRVTTPAGNDVSFEMDGRPVVPETMECTRLNACGVHAHFLGGQIIWAPVEATINGRIVFDGSLAGGGEAYFGLLKTPVVLDIKNGRITKVSGGQEATIFGKWLAKLDDPRMYQLAHICYGFNPGAKLTGIAVEDERVWGCTEWGIGYQSVYYNGKNAPVAAVSHADGICLNSTVYLDGTKVVDQGRAVEPTLAKLAKRLGKQ